MHRVRQRPPLRALVLASILVLIGILLLLMANQLDRERTLMTLGLAGLAIGVALFGAAWLLARSMRVQILLDETGYHLSGPVRSDRGTWTDVSKVTQGPDRITLHRKDGTRLQLVVTPGGRADLDALGEDIATRLDADRGYSQH